MAFIPSAPLRLRPGQAPSSPTPRLSPPVAVHGLGARVAAAAAAATLALSPFAPAADASVFNFAAPRPRDVGVRSERYLAGCPETPNCICSQEDVYNSHYVPSWTYAQGKGGKAMAEAVDDVVRAVEGYQGEFGEEGTVVERRAVKSEVGEGVYVYCEFRTRLMGFVDDVEFLFVPDGQTVEYRSASRVGRDDLKANRTRIRNLRVTLQKVDDRWASSGY